MLAIAAGSNIRRKDTPQGGYDVPAICSKVIWGGKTRHYLLRKEGKYWQTGDRQAKKRPVIGSRKIFGGRGL